jgi:sigma-B regulation protein RsbU (phosphoserine phosphatase)
VWTETRAVAGAAAPRGATILLVDDNAVNLQVLLRSLDGRGHRLLVARDGRTALDIARRVTPDIVLLDVLMPEMGGFEVCAALKAESSTSETPVIFLSALGEVSDKVAGLSLGAVDYITKPIQPEEVLARVDTHLTRHLLEREVRQAYGRLNRELAGAALMQRLLLPRTLPDTEHVRFAAYYQTSRHAGGDYYDVIPLPDGRRVVLALDVSGHGAPAAIVMAMMRTLVHSSPAAAEDANAIFRCLHDHFAFLEETGVYATAIHAVVDAAGGSLRMAVAGHPSPLWWREGQLAAPIECGGTTPLLLRDPGVVQATTHALEAGDRLLFYTDGVTDRESPDGEAYDTPRLAAALARSGRLPVAQAMASIVGDLETFAGGSEPGDDNTLLLMEVR